MKDLERTGPLSEIMYIGNSWCMWCWWRALFIFRNKLLNWKSFCIQVKIDDLIFCKLSREHKCQKGRGRQCKGFHVLSEIVYCCMSFHSFKSFFINMPLSCLLDSHLPNVLGLTGKIYWKENNSNKRREGGPAWQFTCMWCSDLGKENVKWFKTLQCPILLSLWK